jgi:CHAT domain-containing protein
MRSVEKSLSPPFGICGADAREISYDLSMGLAAVTAMPIAVAALLCAPLAAQTRPSESNPKRLIAKADRLAWLYNWYMAGPLYAEAEKVYEQVGDRRNALYAKVGRIRSEWESMSFREVSEYLSAELESDLVQSDEELRLWLLDAKGAVDLEVKVGAARQVYEEFRDLARKRGDKAREARASGELGIIAFMEGETGKSLGLLSEALKTSIELKDVGAHIRYLNLMGNGLTLYGRPEDAIRYFDRALQLVRSTPELDTSTMAIAGKARALVALGKRADAEKLFQDALDLARRRNRRGLAASVLPELGKLANEAGEHERAVAFYKEGVALAEAGELHRLVATASFGLARLYRDLGDLEKAEESAARGIEASQRVGETFELPERLAFLARLRAERGKIEDADRLYEQAEDVVEGLMMSLASPGSRALTIGAMSQIYFDHFTLAVDRLNNPARAFEVLETARGRTAADILRNREPASPANEGQARAHEREIARLQTRLMRSLTREERKEILEKLFDTEQRLYAAKFSGSQWLMEKGDPVQLARFQASLAPDELVLEYALGEPTSYALVIDDTEVRVVTIPGRNRIEALVDQYVAEVRTRKPAMKFAKELHSLLLGAIPELERKPRLIVVPDGRLHLLPFDSLINDKGDYLLSSHVVATAPSSTVLHLLRSRLEGAGSLPLLAVGDVSYPGGASIVATNTAAAKPSRIPTRGLYDLSGERLPPLPGTAEEVATVASIAGPRSIVLTGSKATESTLRSQPLDRIRILHLATHGISSTDSPERAALVLARGTADDDGLLQAREISELNLGNELVTLSACDTGAGRLVGQEGIVNLVRAFQFAGARTVVASLWAADDVFTTSLMKRFYGNLAKGLDRGAALQRAKLDLVEQFGDQAVPFLWAGFTMVGDASKPVNFSE